MTIISDHRRKEMAGNKAAAIPMNRHHQTVERSVTGSQNPFPSVQKQQQTKNSRREKKNGRPKSVSTFFSLISVKFLFSLQ